MPSELVQRVIPIAPDNPYPLGRNVHHDPRSLSYAAPSRPMGAAENRQWNRFIPVLDQANLHAQGIHITGNPDGLNSCTGQAGIGVVGAEPFFHRVRQADQKALHDSTQAERYAISLYAKATQQDEFIGTFPPTDDGSSGLGVAKVLKEHGLITRYEHAFGLAALVTALQDGVVMIGTNWYSSMFTPKTDGTVELAGDVAGGHEYLGDGVWPDQRMIRCVNSWGESWGDRGYFFLTFDQMERLLGEQGDVVVPRLTA